MNLIEIAHVPPVEVTSDDSVLEAVDRSILPRVGAVVVTENGRMVGLITERDVMYKVVHGRLDPAKTKVSEVMSAPPIYISSKGTIQETLHLMAKHHIRHLPISDDGVTVAGVLSIRNVLQCLLEDLEKHALHLEEYVTSGLNQ